VRIRNLWLEELTALSDHIDLGIYDLTSDTELAQHYNVDKAPGIVIAAKDGDTVVDYGIRTPASLPDMSLVH